MADAPRYDDSLTIALLRARDAVTAQFRDHVGAAGLTLQQWRVIRALAGGTALDTTTLAKRCVILAPSLTRILRHLGDAGLVETVPSRDRRQRVIRLTPAGETLFIDIWQVSQQKYAAIEDAFGKDELRDLVVSLNRLRASLETDQETGDVPA
ncbi:MAG: MarR family transcriptional regulator [Alphaproteobacteria bacterium]|nr:MarR family transcriptional regulator [Alphaproteobacteria bacterium]